MKVAKKAALVIVTAGLAAGASAGAASATEGGAHATGVAQHSPGVGSGNAVQVPVHVPVNLTGNTVNVIGLLNPALGNASVNH
ncbi:chaplin [Streptomyces sp. NPDC088147]|uniref:chaplin n=1 Tax=unclassified Streptomyces TaxID=2593676 RepID=UPI00101B6210|nr:chaplin [Streptomyces sp. L-9-10]RYJ27137.1 putative secreted protein [Streptomyces sp. L-9-10]